VCTRIPSKIASIYTDGSRAVHNVFGLSCIHLLLLGLPFLWVLTVLLSCFVFEDPIESSLYSKLCVPLPQTSRANPESISNQSSKPGTIRKSSRSQAHQLVPHIRKALCRFKHDFVFAPHVLDVPGWPFAVGQNARIVKKCQSVDIGLTFDTSTPVPNQPLL